MFPIWKPPKPLSRVAETGTRVARALTERSHTVGHRDGGSWAAGRVRDPRMGITQSTHPSTGARSPMRATLFAQIKTELLGERYPMLERLIESGIIVRAVQPVVV